MSRISPLLADAVRKVCALGLSVGITVLMLRVMFRLSRGRQDLWEPELWLLLALSALAVTWIAKARPVRQAPAGSSESPPQAVPPGARQD